MYIVCSYVHVCKAGCTKTKRQVAWATNFLTIVPNIYGFSVWNLLYVTLLAPGLAPTFSEICALLTLG
jgi:hypothetical protein